MRYEVHPVITFTSPAAENTTAVQTSYWDNLDQYDWLTLIGILTGATGGTLDVYIQAELKYDVWVDWVHFPQKAAAAATTRHVLDCHTAATSMTTVGVGSTSTPAVALAASTVAFSHPGKKARIVAVSGAGTSAGASQSLYLIKWRRR